MPCSVPAEAPGCVSSSRGMCWGERSLFGDSDLCEGRAASGLCREVKSRDGRCGGGWSGHCFGVPASVHGPSLVYNIIRWTGGGKGQSPTLDLCSSICCTWDTYFRLLVWFVPAQKIQIFMKLVVQIAVKFMLVMHQVCFCKPPPAPLVWQSSPFSKEWERKHRNALLTVLLIQ